MTTNIEFRGTIVAALFMALTFIGASSDTWAMDMPTVQAKLTTLPEVPAPITRKQPAKVVVNVEAKEYVGTLADDVQYKFWSFNGTVPGPMIRVRQGDMVELHLKNHKDNKFSHNMDLHAVNGPGGGASANLAFPGQEGVFSFHASTPGLFIYHCASPVPNIPAHIANGMYGLILVDPKDGLPAVDHEFAIMESEFYTMPSKDKGVMELSMEKGLAEHPDHVVFNGRAGALMGEELQAKAREIAVRLANGPTVAYRYMKENFNRVISSGDVDDCLDLEATHHVHCGQTDDHRQAVKAFVEKKEPVFQGR